MTEAERYDNVSYDLARLLTLRYSSSFGSASRLFGPSIRPHIYAIYGIVRIADEIVDTYQGDDRTDYLDAFESEVYAAVASGYSTNPIIHAFALTARSFDITSELIQPFFTSMRTDLTRHDHTPESYDEYIYGSAEVIGLMCLKVFVSGDKTVYELLSDGARSLGRAYQKVNFLRDIAADHSERGRIYFPGVTFTGFDDAAKDEISADIHRDFDTARPAISKLPATARRAVSVSYAYYTALLNELDRASADTLKHTRIRVPDWYKTLLFSLSIIRLRS